MKDVVACEKSRGACKLALIRECPNGETHHASGIPQGRRTQGTETSKYLQEKKSTEIPLVVASERGRAESLGCSGMFVEKTAIQGDSPVHETT